jgi:hypothetical protein
MRSKMETTTKANDYIFTYIGNNDTEKFICSAENGDIAMKKFNEQIGSVAIVDIERK